jgi:hypothetical protein
MQRGISLLIAAGLAAALSCNEHERSSYDMVVDSNTMSPGGETGELILSQVACPEQKLTIPTPNVSNGREMGDLRCVAALKPGQRLEVVHIRSKGLGSCGSRPRSRVGDCVWHAAEPKACP